MPVYSTACPRNCYSTCSFKVHVEDNRVVNIEPHLQNRATPEGICLKGLSYVERANSPQRILYPMKKTNDGSFERISWDSALITIAANMKRLKQNYGAHTILFYAASGMSGLLNGQSLRFWELFGGSTLTYGNLCWPAGLEATRLTLGDNKHNAPWDLQHARLIVFWGKNPAETNIQEMIQVEKAQQAGAKVVVIDPRCTPTAQKADWWLQPRPGTDAALALGVTRRLIQKKLIDYQFIRKHVKGFELFAQSVEGFSARKAAEITGISEADILQLADSIGTIAPMTLVPGYGMQRYTNGGQTIRCLLALSALTGNIGKKGACWHYANLQSDVFSMVKEPVSYYPPKITRSVFRRSVSTARLGQSILAAENPRLRMIWVERGNPLAQNPDTNTVLQAFRAMDFRVVVEQFMTDTAREADIVLPAKNLFEQTDLITSYWNPYIQLKPKVTEPPGEVKTELEIYHLLAGRLGYTPEEISQYLIGFSEDAIENYLKEQLRTFPELNFEHLRKGPLLADIHEEIAFADMNFNTPSGKIELFSEQAIELWNVNPLPTYEEPHEFLSSEKKNYPLHLLTPNTKNRIHSQFNNLEVIRQFSPEPVVYMHPEDAIARNLKNNDMVNVFNDRGNITIKLKLDFSISPRCVSISNGWWISEGGNPNFLSAARETDMGYGTAFHDNLVEIKKRDHWS